MELTKERLIIIIAVAVVIVILGVYLVLYRPLSNKIRTARLECNSIEAEVLQARNQIVPLKQEVTKKGLIIEEDISLAIDELTKLGKSKGLNFNSITPKEIRKSEHPQCNILPIVMDIESTYKDLGIFLGSLEGLQNSLMLPSCDALYHLPNKRSCRHASSWYRSHG